MVRATVHNRGKSIAAQFLEETLGNRLHGLPDVVPSDLPSKRMAGPVVGIESGYANFQLLFMSLDVYG